MARGKFPAMLCRLLVAFSAALAATGTLAQVASPHRKAGWWEMAARLPDGKTLTRYLCLDVVTDARHSVLSAEEGCTLTVQKIAGGYAFKNVCGASTTNGTAIGDFNSAYKITEQRGKDQVQTEARWLGACPAGRQPGDMLLPNGRVMNSR